jgi:hypothetical protein
MKPDPILTSDFAIANHGSILLLTPLTNYGVAWIDEHIPADAMTWGGHSIVVEPRYMADIVRGIFADGLTVDGLKPTIN